MKLHEDNQQFEGIVPTERVAFTIQTNAKMFSILSDGIYKDKIAAVIRELSCNAHDAHVAANNKKPFTVKVPSSLDPTFAVEDEGTGIDPTKIAKIFWTYGNSTKTDTNDQIGALGLGSKSPFAYTKSSFIVYNRYNGVEHAYLCFINEQGTPDGSVIGQTPTDKPNGVRVELAVRSEDILVFQQKIKQFFAHWKKLPNFVGVNNFAVSRFEAKFTGKGWKVLDHTQRKAYAVMGNVAYPIDFTAVPNATEAVKFISDNPFVVDFALGELSFQASREELSYDEPTVKALTARCEEVCANLIASLRHDVESKSANLFELASRVRGLKMFIIQAFGRNSGTIDGIFDKNTKFTALNGRSLALNECTGSEHLKFDGHLPLSIMTADSSWMTPSTLKQKVSLRLVKQLITGPLSPEQCKDEEYMAEKYLPWFKLDTKPSKSVTAKAGHALELGYCVEESEFDIELNKYTAPLSSESVSRPAFYLNDAGHNGLYSFRRMKFRGETAYLVTVDPTYSCSDFGLSLLKDLFENTQLEGLELIPLTKAPGYQPPPKRDRASSAGARGTVEVREVTYSLNHQKHILFGGSNLYFKHDACQIKSAYTRIDPTVTDALCVLIKNEADVYALTFLGELWAANQLAKWTTTAEIKLLPVNEETYEKLKARGAKLTRVSELLANVQTDSVLLAEAIKLNACSYYHLQRDDHQQLTKLLKNELPAKSEFLELLSEVSSAIANLRNQRSIALYSMFSSVGLVSKNISASQKLKAKYPMINSDNFRLKHIKHVVLYVTVVEEANATAPQLV